MQWWILKISSRFLQLPNSLPTFITYSVKFFAMIYCKVNVIIAKGIYFTGFT